MARKKNHTPTKAAPVTSYKHNKDKRKRIPTQEESVKLSARDKQPVKKRYDPSMDPRLFWVGKYNSDSANVREIFGNCL